MPSKSPIQDWLNQILAAVIRAVFEPGWEAVAKVSVLAVVIVVSRVVMYRYG